MRPLNQFCCGCPLSFGAYLIIFINLTQNMFYIVTATMNIILQIPTFGYGMNLASQTFNAAWCLLGLPFIACALWGVRYRLEANLRLYLLYQFSSFCLDMMYLFAFFFLHDMCNRIPSLLRRHGAAFACGFIRVSGLFLVSMLVIIEIYFIFTIWSLCEDLKAGGEGAGLPALLCRGRQALTKRRYLQSHRDHLYGTNNQANGFSAGYGGFGAMGPGLGGSASRIFGGGYHETAFPPPSRF